MTEYSKPRSGGLLTTWEDIDIVCDCGNRFGAFPDNPKDEVVWVSTCPDCGQKFRVTGPVIDVIDFIPYDQRA